MKAEDLIKATVLLLLLLTLLGCGAGSPSREPRAELFGVYTSYTNADTCGQEGGGLCYDRLDLLVTVVNTGEVALPVAFDRFRLTSAGGEVFRPHAYMGRCEAELRPGQTLRCTLPFWLEPALPGGALFPARLAFPHAQTVEINP